MQVIIPININNISLANAINNSIVPPQIQPSIIIPL